MPSHPERQRVKRRLPLASKKRRVNTRTLVSSVSEPSSRRGRTAPAARSRSVPFNARRKAISKRSDKGNAASFVGVLGGNKKRGTTRKRR